MNTYIDSLKKVVAHITYIIYGILKIHSVICMRIEFTYCLCSPHSTKPSQKPESDNGTKCSV